MNNEIKKAIKRFASVVIITTALMIIHPVPSAFGAEHLIFLMCGIIVGEIWSKL